MPWPYDSPPEDPINTAELVALERDAAARRAHANKLLLTGALLFAVGLVVTLVTYSSASSGRGGGTYIVAWGPMVFGALRMFRGLASR